MLRTLQHFDKTSKAWSPFNKIEDLKMSALIQVLQWNNCVSLSQQMSCGRTLKPNQFYFSPRISVSLSSSPRASSPVRSCALQISYLQISDRKKVPACLLFNTGSNQTINFQAVKTKAALPSNIIFLRKRSVLWSLPLSQWLAFLLAFNIANIRSWTGYLPMEP